MRVRDGRGPIVQERTIRAPVERVFEAWSDPSGLRVWMCPGEIRSAEAEVDFRVGGRFRIVMHGAEQDYVQHGEYLEIEPPKRLVFTWVSEFVPEAEARTRVSVSFEPAGKDATRVRLVHEELPDSDTYDGHAQGWADILAKLEHHLGASALRSRGGTR